MSCRNYANSLAKVFYRPLEAAIRWSGMVEHEAAIMSAMEPHALLDPGALAKWPVLQFNAFRILDAIQNRELPCGIDGFTTRGPVMTAPDRLTVRHVDLKDWAARAYPEERPEFLFGISDALPVQVGGDSTPMPMVLSARSEAALLNIIGGLLLLHLEALAPGEGGARYPTQAAVIVALLQRHGQRLGITRRTLESKFAAARRGL